MAHLAENKYGKSRVRLVKVIRGPDRHEMKEWKVGVYFQGDFTTCFTVGDNSKILPTDTMKNTVYYVAKQSNATSMEEFGKNLGDYFLSRNTQVSSVSVEMEEKTWEHVLAGDQAHPTTFQQRGPEVHTAKVRGDRGQQGKGAQFVIESGISGLVIMKTAKSGFAGYIEDPLTTLPETHDRLFGTEAEIKWLYQDGPHDFPAFRAKIVSSLLSSFANHESFSVQHTLFAMGQEALDAVPQLREMTLTMPNRHCLMVDLARFGQENANEIFVPIDEPHGYIEARVTRG